MSDQRPLTERIQAALTDEVLDEVLDVPDEWDEAYERAAAHARDTDFEETFGKDWT